MYLPRVIMQLSSPEPFHCDLQQQNNPAGVSPRHIACIGISAQRSSFVTWHKETGKPFHNFITWKDVRADSLVRQWNDSVTMKGLRVGALCLYTVSRSKRFLAGSVLKLMNSQVTLRLVWALQNVKTLIDAAANHEAMFGTVDTWILYKLTGGRLHVTDVSNASATGFFDPFTMKWANWALRLFQIPSDMLPEVWDTAADFGCLTPDIIGHAIPIRSLVADQAASLFGSCCFEEGDVKVTLGTGTFLNVNTGCKPFASVEGLYPQVGWRFGKEIVYVMEGASHDTGSLINWAQQIGLVSDPCESSDMAISVQDSNGLYFIPAFSGIQLSKSAKLTWGLQHRALRIIYTGGILPLILYGAPIWKGILENKCYIIKLIRVQRLINIKIAKAYRTVSNEALCLVMGLTPINIKIEEFSKYYEYIREKGNLINREMEVKFWSHPADFVKVVDDEKDSQHQLQVYTDGSKSTEGTGSGIAIFTSTNLIAQIKYKLNRKCTNNQAEQLVILKVLKHLQQSNGQRTVTIHTDSRITLQLLKNRKIHTNLIEEIRRKTKEMELQGWNIEFRWIKAHAGHHRNEIADRLAKEAATSREIYECYNRIPKSVVLSEMSENSVVTWQREWDQTTKGATTKSFLPNVVQRLKLKINTSPNCTSLITGHGNIKSYLHKYKIIDNPMCTCNTAEQSVDHLIYDCKLIEQERETLKAKAPINNFQAAAGFIGIKPTTSRQHMMRAILESIAFRVVQLFHSLQKEVKSHYTSIRVDGGVSRNDFVTQTLADLTGLKVERPTSSEMSVLGAAFLAGLHAGNTINIRYPPQNWLHLYTDGSLLSREQGAGAGVTCCLFSLYRSLGYGTTSFDGEIIAISECLRNLLCHINKFRNAVILSDSKAAILSIVSRHTPSSQTAEITKMLSQLISLNKRIVFQRIPSHCGILGNENVDALAKKGSTATYRPVTKSTYYSVKRFIKSTYKQNLITKSQGKKWNSLHQNPQLIPDLPRKSSVAAFRLVTGHDCLAKHLHRIGIYQSPNCPLCNSNQEMDSEHFKICASVAGHDNIFEKYWSARGQMTLLSNAWH
ncbi:hypothetical protein ANN_01179 [Periplaneta americana]|uniref:glycerol kinase n=1 Tax=Periplaneta americana TaxID=6978 RepID=A0ABQ8TWX1_PERAM|nr:hypothetical protein ANN_01179 [Periplaneta americana]